MLQTKSKVYKFRKVSINRSCNDTFSVAIKKPRYEYNSNTSVFTTSQAHLISLIPVSKL